MSSPIVFVTGNDNKWTEISKILSVTGINLERVNLDRRLMFFTFSIGSIKLYFCYDFSMQMLPKPKRILQLCILKHTYFCSNCHNHS